MIWTGKQLKKALGVSVDLNLQTGIVQFNSKDVSKGDLFISLPGSGSTDSHKYAKDAIDHGAACVIVERPVQGVASDKTIVVENTRLALKQLASYKRANSKAKFIAITGSVGKTSTKEALKIIFETFGRTFAGRGNFNNDLGVSINLASMANDIEYAIFELGMNHAGEIRELVKSVKPDIAMITAISAAHLEFFNSVEDIVDAKCEIFEGMGPESTAVINRDSQYYDRMIQNIDGADVQNICTFGVSELADARLEEYNVGSAQTEVIYNVNNTKVVVEVPYILPAHQAENFAGCLSIVSCLNLQVTKAAEALKKFTLGEGRGKMVKVRKNEKEFKVICDYYNANPASLTASLKFFKQINHKSKVVIIGDMRELGPSSPKLHEELVPFIIDSGATKIILVGEQVKFINDLLPKKLYIRHFNNVDMLIPALESILENNDLVLIKGSRGINLDKVLEYFDKD